MRILGFFFLKYTEKNYSKKKRKKFLHESDRNLDCKIVRNTRGSSCKSFRKNPRSNLGSSSRKSARMKFSGRKSEKNFRRNVLKKSGNNPGRSFEWNRKRNSESNARTISWNKCKETPEMQG